MAAEHNPATCPQHPEQAVSGNCVGCGKPICRECSKQFGYYCSQPCLEKGRRTVTEKSRQRARETEAALRRSTRAGKLLLLALPLLLALGVLAIVWHFFLDPAGKVCWQWQGPASAGRATLLGADPVGVTVLQGDTVVVLDPASGAERQSFLLPRAGTGKAAPGAADQADAEADEGDDDSAYAFYGPGGQFHLLRDGSLLRQSRGGLCRLGTGGSVAFNQTYEEGTVSHLAISPDETRVVCVVTVPVDVAVARKAKAILAQANAEMRKAFEESGWSEGAAGAETDKLKALRLRLQSAQELLEQTRTGIVCLDLASGKEVWASPKMKKGVSVTALASGPRGVYAVFLSAPTDAAEASGVSYNLFAFDPTDGSRHWQADLDSAPTWGPVTCGEQVLVLADGELKAYKADGSDAYSLPLPEKGGARPLLRDGLLFLLDGTSCRCLDPATGQEKWGVALATSEQGIVVTAKRVYLAGEVEETVAGKDAKLPPAYQDLEKMPELKGVLEQAKRKIVPMIFALERETGAELWRLRNAYGTLLADEARVVLVADTAQTSMLEAATGGKGVTLIRQFNPESGKQRYTRQSPLGFAEPHLVGKRLIGLAYERTERPSVFHPGGGEESGMPKALGLAAYRVK